MKKLEEMNLIDDFLMNAVTSDPEVGEASCRCLLSVLLERRIGSVKVVSQRFIQGLLPGLRGIRMDVEVVEGKPNEPETIAYVYDIEPHTRNDMVFPRANRFRQAKIDSRYMESGDNDFSNLPDLYMITITNFDIFGKGRMMYTFHTVCEGESDIKYDDGLHRIYFNTAGTKGGSQDIKNMLNYIQDSKVSAEVDNATRELAGYVSKVRLDPEIRRSVMTFGDIIDRENRQAAREAVHNTKVEDILELLEEVGDVPDSVSETLEQTTDMEYLKKFHKIAAHVGTMEEFEEKMNEVLQLTTI